MGSASMPGSYADTAKRLAGRSLYAVGSGLVAGSRLVAKGVGALTADTSDKEPIRFLKFALLAAFYNFFVRFGKKSPHASY